MINLFHSSLLLLILTATNLFAQEKNCTSQFTYGDTSSSNYLEFNSGKDKRTFFFESVDVYKNDKGGFTLYLPSFGFDTYTHNLTTIQKKSPYQNIIEDLCKVYFAWYPEESFESDKYDFIEGDLLSNDCFFSNNRRELRRLYRTSTAEIKIDTSTSNGLKNIIVTSQSKEDNSISLKINVETKHIKEPLSFDQNKLKVISSEMDIENCSFRRMYYYKNQRFLVIDKPGRKPSFTISSINGCKFGIPKPGKFKAYKLRELPNRAILIQQYLVSTENEKLNEDAVFTLPLNNKAKQLSEYDLNSIAPTESYLSSTFITLSAQPLIIEGSGKKTNSINTTSNYQPFYRTIVSEDLADVQNIDTKKIKPYNFYFTDPEGKLYRTKAQKSNDIIVYSCEEVFFMPTSITVDFKSRFSSEAAYFAYAEVLIAGDDFIKQGINAKENSQEHTRFIQQIEKAELDSLLSDDKRTTAANFRAFSDKTSNVEKDYVIYDYLAHHKDIMLLFHSYLDAKKNVNSKKLFHQSLKPIIQHYSIDTDNYNDEELLEISEDSLTTNYNRSLIRIVEKGSVKSKLLFTVKQDAQGGTISSLVKPYDAEEKLSLEAEYNDENISLRTKGFHKTYETVMKSCENIWDARQIYLNLPFLPLDNEYTAEIYFTNFNQFTKQTKGQDGATYITPQVSASYNKVELAVKGTEQIIHHQKKEEVFVVQMNSTSKLEGLPGINDQTWSRKDDLMVNEDGSAYANIYMSTSFPHQIFYIQLKKKKINFLNEDDANNINNWYKEALLQN